VSEFNLDWQKGYEEGLQVGIENESNRIIKLLDNPYFHNIQSPDIHVECEMCKTIELVKGEQKWVSGQTEA